MTHAGLDAMNILLRSIPTPSQLEDGPAGDGEDRTPDSGLNFSYGNQIELHLLPAQRALLAPTW